MKHCTRYIKINIQCCSYWILYSCMPGLWQSLLLLLPPSFLLQVLVSVFIVMSLSICKMCPIHLMFRCYTVLKYVCGLMHFLENLLSLQSIFFILLQTHTPKVSIAFLSHGKLMFRHHKEQRSTLCSVHSSSSLNSLSLPEAVFCSYHIASLSHSNSAFLYLIYSINHWKLYFPRYTEELVWQGQSVYTVVVDGRYTGGNTVSLSVGDRAPVGSAGAIISAVGRVRNAIVTSLNVVPRRPSLIVLVASYIMHAPPPDAALEQLLIIANADDYLIFERGTNGLRIVLRRRRPRPWLIEIRRWLWREQATGDYTALSGGLSHWEQTSPARTKTAQRLELWQCSEQV